MIFVEKGKRAPYINANLDTLLPPSLSIFRTLPGDSPIATQEDCELPFAYIQRQSADSRLARPPLRECNRFDGENILLTSDLKSDVAT